MCNPQPSASNVMIMINSASSRRVLDPVGKTDSAIHPRGAHSHQTLVGGQETAGYSGKCSINRSKFIRPRYIIGIDEVGRGALAGPVVVAGIMAKSPFRIKNRRLGKLRDSKKLTALKREEWFKYLAAHPKFYWFVSRVTPRVIDRINISRAADRAALRIIKKLAPDKKLFFAYLDGGLRLPERIPHKALIKGDEKMKIIAASSIIAKVTRDRAMVRLHKKDSRYRFDIHKGYGTKLHKKFLRQYGRSDVHRKSFAF